MKIKVSNVNTPNWKEVTVKSRIPEELEKLSEIARNIWWAWNFEATELFRDLDPELWKECGQNPVLLLERMSSNHISWSYPCCFFIYLYRGFISSHFYDFTNELII